MAPVTDPFPVPGLEGLILENCRFFSSPDTELSLVVAKELGQFRAVVLQTKENFRGPLLVETGPTIYWALHSLMVKSAEFVQNYIQTSGYSVVPRTNETKAYKEAHGFGDSEHGSDDNQGHDAESVTSRSTSCPAYTSQSVPEPSQPPVKRHNMPYHNRMNGVSGVNFPPLPPPPPGWSLRNMELNGGIGNGVSHASPPYHPPPPPPPPLLPDGFARAGSGKEPCWSFQQFNHFQSQNRSCHRQAMRPTDQYLRPGSIQHVQLPSQTLPATAATQSVPPAFSAIDVAVPGSNPKPNGHSLKPEQSQHHIPPPPPPPPPFPPMSRVVNHVYGSAPWHVQRLRAYTTAGIIPPPPPPPPPLTSIHVPASSSTSSSSSATTTITPNASPNLPSVAPRFFQGASSTTSSSPSAPSISTFSSPNPTANQNSITIPCSSCGDSDNNKPTSTTPPVLITIGFPS
ncbi:hypothetical protein NEUTE1DRAFT_100788 [Neurospora tetrasperma FGSC 2508]|uniref:Uncharacterized protein n=1 Tax=Neurospora tetrasperma (strain FGSC 2508 / ATCC MYA-4615 / P0657) TaxID=510951 RepID=F8MMM9_NEUT8|nr:uncharacterized protein NEUTE1DRAFT_100788 [Neurospora tetrasperma FGSC 2508]EGO57903.1 hypothetical protein NEUTE1DRAFT_100788 [Neurospora tetrasperma FGSC 2508]EGZ71809.1 hypothetical protein NEUTE2DRAFT_66131 [Neurospora tetrasperma FGSC 2509]